MIEKIIAPLFSLYMAGCSLQIGATQPPKTPAPQSIKVVQECTEQQRTKRSLYLQTKLDEWHKAQTDLPCTGPGEMYYSLSGNGCNPTGRVAFRCTPESKETRVPSYVGPTIAIDNAAADKLNVEFR